MADRIFSARVDESTIRRIADLAKRLKQSKKQILESAVQEYAQNFGQESQSDILKETSGLWQRKETAAKTVELSKKAFRRSMKRHQE